MAHMTQLIFVLNFVFLVSVEADGRKRPAVSMIDKDHISTAELEEYEVVIVPDFIISMKNYVEILTSMARHTVCGILHSFFTKDDAAHAGQMIEILEQCGPVVPDALRDLCHTSPMLEWWSFDMLLSIVSFLFFFIVCVLLLASWFSLPENMFCWDLNE